MAEAEATEPKSNGSDEPPFGLLAARILLKSESHRKFRQVLLEAKETLTTELVYKATSTDDLRRIQSQLQVFTWILGPAEEKYLESVSPIDMQPQGQVASGLMDEDLPYQGEDEQ